MVSTGSPIWWKSPLRKMPRATSPLLAATFSHRIFSTLSKRRRRARTVKSRLPMPFSNRRRTVAYWLTSSKGADSIAAALMALWKPPTTSTRISTRKASKGSGAGSAAQNLKNHSPVFRGRPAEPAKQFNLFSGQLHLFKRFLKLSQRLQQLITLVQGNTGKFQLPVVLRLLWFPVLNGLRMLHGHLPRHPNRESCPDNALRSESIRKCNVHIALHTICLY